MDAGPITPPVTATTRAIRVSALLRVLVVTPPGALSEDEDWVLRMVTAAGRLQPTFVSLPGDGLPHEPAPEGAGGGERPTPPRGGVLLAGARLLRSQLRRLDPDVVLANGAAAAAAVLPAALLTGHRVVRVEHRHDSPLPAWLARRASAVVATSGSTEHGGTGGRGAVLIPPAPDRGPEALDDPEVRQAAHLLAGVLAEAVGQAGAGIDPGDAPPMSVVVPVWREGALVDDLVDALVPQLRPDDELVLVDDGSPDDTAERAERAAAAHPQVRALRLPRNAGAAAARNAGVRVARHAHLAFTDAGNHWRQGWLDAMRTPFAEEPAPDLVAGAYEVSRRGVFEAASAVGCYPDVNDARRSGPLASTWSTLFGRRLDPTRPAGRSIAVTRRALDSVGGWPEHVRAHEDLDMARAIAERGLRCVLTTLSPVLWDQAGLRGTLRMYVRYGRGDAEATDHQALVRDAARVAAYVVGPLGLLRGRSVVRAAMALSAAAYVSVPLARARKEARPVATAALVPVVIVLRDLAKAWGAARVVLERWVARRRR